MPQALTLSHVTKLFSQTPLFANINFTFIQGQSYALSGPSGAGKSTLLHMLAGFDTPQEGIISFSGTDIRGLNAQCYVREHIGFIHQVPHLLDELSIVENVMIKGLIAQQSYNECRQKALELLALVGLADKASVRPRTLSGGEQQRVAVVRALFAEPTFILADEPTAHLDQVTAQILVDLIRSYKSSGLIMVSHDPQVTIQLDHLLYLSDGTLHEVQVTQSPIKEQYV